MGRGQWEGAVGRGNGRSVLYHGLYERGGGIALAFGISWSIGLRCGDGDNEKHNLRLATRPEQFSWISVLLYTVWWRSPRPRCDGRMKMQCMTKGGHQLEIYNV